ncbi:hypothetical protein B0J11DRAFT_266393 [Dendryphion nanum]|uniref:Ubiquitin-like domain-containing protein n=1 Tax=Dendryphion nanum TaxID=256645 RepID=A0A9P9IMT0_9PLEO|nr:hypothetical protein B0J11DRAFT_266393 [Dendryphion nanum]
MSDDEEQLLVNLKVLSPSTEVKSDIALVDLPAATTIQELRNRIRNEIESRPAVDRMRLIYRGRVMMRDADTLIDVFGLDSIHESKNQTLHLVLRELPTTDAVATSSTPRSSTAPPQNPFRAAQAPPEGTAPVPPNTANPFRPNSQPPPQVHQHPNPHHHHHHHHVHNRPPHQPPLGLAGLPPILQQQLGQAMAQNQQMNNAHGQPLGQPQSRDGSPAPVAPVQPGQGLPPPPMGPGQGPTHLPPGTSRTVRHEGIGPNGERWTVTNTTLALAVHGPPQPMLPRPFPHPPGFAVPRQPSPIPLGQAGQGVDQLLARIGAELQTARQEMGSARLLLQQAGRQEANAQITSQQAGSGANPAGPATSANAPLWRIDRVRLHIHNVTQHLNNLQRSFEALLSEPSMVNNRDFIALQHAANSLRGQADEINSMLQDMNRTQHPFDGSSSHDSIGAVSDSSPARAATDGAAATQLRSPQSATIPAPVEPELFILSSPQGPVGILFDQRGTYSTAPMAPTLPFQTFTHQFSANRRVLAGLQQQFGQNNAQFQNRIAAVQPMHQAQVNQPIEGVQIPAHQAPAGNQNQANAPAPVPAPAPAQVQPPAPEQDRVMVVFGHAWLIVKLAFFMYFFAGGGGWYRPFMIGTIAALVYLANLGIFEGQFDIIRRHFEALLPLDARAAQPPNPAAEAAQPQPGQVIRGRRPTPEAAAQRLVQQAQERRNGWIRGTFRGTERALALFLASLWPGIGERMVQAQEERDRAAEAERVRIEQEERERIEAEAEKQRVEAEGREKEKVETEGEASNTVADDVE